MKAIGIRAQAKQINYSIVKKIEIESETVYEILAQEKFIIPQALEMPDRLSYIRTSFGSIIKEFNVSNAGIRICEIVASAGTIERSYIEGVLQELLSNCTVNLYFSGRKTTIARLLQTKQETITKYFEGESIFMDIDNWKGLKKEERESIVAAFAALRLGV